MSPNDFGKKILAEQCQKIRLSNFTGKANHQIKEAVLKSLVGAEGYNIQFTRSKTGFGGTRFWFSCPICGRRAGIISLELVTIGHCKAFLGLCPE